MPRVVPFNRPQQQGENHGFENRRDRRRLWAASLGVALADRVAQRARSAPPSKPPCSGDGFTEWKEVELDDGTWEVDDALNTDGHKYDVEIDPKSYVIVRKDRDD